MLFEATYFNCNPIVELFNTGKLFSKFDVFYHISQLKSHPTQNRVAFLISVN